VLAESGTRQELIDQSLVGIRTSVGQEGCQLFGFRGKSGQYQGRSASQRSPIGLWREIDSGLS
jgi:hypothetical protein